MRTSILAGLLVTAITVPVSAQDKPQHSSPPPAPAAQSAAPKNHGDKTHGEMWRSSKLIGLNVYNDKNEKLGDINEILVDKSGKIDGFVIGVGGFLGMGEHDIMVEMSKLKFVDEPVRTSTTSTTPSTSGSGTATRPAPTARTTTTANHKWYPDHAVLAGATKESLKSTPQFKYD